MLAQPYRWLTIAKPCHVLKNIRKCTLLHKIILMKGFHAITNKAVCDPDKSLKGQLAVHIRSEKRLFFLIFPSLSRVHALLTLKGKLWTRGRALMHSELPLKGLFIFAAVRGCFLNSLRAERKEMVLGGWGVLWGGDDGVGQGSLRLPTSWTSSSKHLHKTGQKRNHGKTAPPHR